MLRGERTAAESPASQDSFLQYGAESDKASARGQSALKNGRLSCFKYTTKAAGRKWDKGKFIKVLEFTGKDCEIEAETAME